MQCLVKGARNVKSVSLNTGSALRTSTSRTGFSSAKFSTKLSRSNIVVAPLVSTNEIFQRSFSAEVKPAYDTTELENREHNANLLRLITAYRRYGHILADLDPLGLEKKSPPPELDLSRYGLNKVPKDKQFPLPGLIKIGDKKTATLEEILTHLKQVYCGKVGTEFLYTQQVDQRKWFSDQIEDLPFRSLSKEEKLRAYKLLAEAEAFDHFMQKKFPFIKRYALEGTESMMVAIDQVFEYSAKSNVDNVIIGMPHRGRLNFLVDLLQYPARQLFWKVKGNSELPPNAHGIGDVLSHIGQSVDLEYNSKKLHVNLLQNPSHLEAITPVTLGKVRAKQEAVGDRNGDKTVAVLFHGDASFYGQGTIAESLILSKLPEFKTGGSVHIIVNNQLGFTTAPTQARSSRYSADVGKMIDVPVIHVNADHPEEVAKAVRVAVEFRQKFREDIIIDIIGYRRHGHNELDEPSFTSPLMYNKIRSRPSVVKLYGEQLIKEGILTSEQAADIITKENNRLEEELKNASGTKTPTYLQGKWKGLVQPTDVTKNVDTGVNVDTLRKIAEKSVEVPSGFEVHERLRRTFAKKRLDDVSKDVLDWATCESLAIGSLLLEGHNTRICGQDVGRGTFSQRHAELIDQNTEKRWVPLNHIQDKQAKLKPVNSPLSELAVLGFEYGFSIEDPKNLVIWEAQFGDFANGAQVMIDQFISSGEPKWMQQTGLVVLLPHGYDGAGPEHSNSRPERFLQLIEGDALNNKNPINRTTNMYVANASTPANYFHLLRRQLKTNYRKPLIVMSPKTILRASKAVSKFSEIAPGTHFLPVIGDTINPEGVKRVILVSGKLYYELAEEREKRGYAADTALVRVEEFAPFPIDQIAAEMNKYKNASKFVWAQEEPQNGGFWFYVEPRLNQLQKFEYQGRPACPASAVGTSVANKQEYENLINSIFPKK